MNKINDLIKKNINLIIAIFLLLQPLLDLATGLCLHLLKINLTIGIIIRITFLLFIVIITLFVFKKKNILVPYFIIGLYCIFYLIGIFLYKDGNIFQEIQGLIKVIYFPVLLLSLYYLKDEIRISSFTLFTVLLFYLILIFVPTILGVGYKTYEITKAGTLGFFNSANEISGIISILTPIMFIILVESRNKILKLLLTIIYLVVILMIGTKTPLLSLGITILISFIFVVKKSLIEKKYKNIGIFLLLVTLVTSISIVIIPRTNFYKNIKTHLDYLKLDSITDVFKDEKLIDHFIFSERLTFLKKKHNLYKKAPIYQKLFGIGYINNKTTKLIEMDYFDILYSEGIIGFIIIFSILIYVLYKTLKEKNKSSFTSYMYLTSLTLILFLSFFTGHIITSPSVSLLSIIIILSLSKRKKKSLMFAATNLEIGGIETACLNLLNSLNYQKYDCYLILEEKKGTLLPKLNKKVIVKELKVSNNKCLPLRKFINLSRKLIFTIFNYHNYDFSCCYATYSYSANKLALTASKNNAFYVHSDYKYVYKNESDFRNFFDTRNVKLYNKIIFVSNESRASFLEIYKEFNVKTLVLNNLINIDEIREKSREEISLKKDESKTLFVFVGRLDDSSKKLKRAIKLVKDIPDIKLWIIGDGEDRKMYESYVTDLKLKDRVTFTGKKLNPYPYMEKADYIILTSDYEGFPVTYLEALALNKQLITTINTSDDCLNIKDYAYIIPKDSKEMKEAVTKILKNKEMKESVDLEKIQNSRLKQFENIFDEVI